jgi:endogenous inhibitor of DNA gyrase (YacG/DUF329 family)
MPVISCRRCDKVLQYERLKDLPFFPFCSKKCRLLDLGKWFDGEHRIEGNAENEEAPPKGR